MNFPTEAPKTRVFVLTSRNQGTAAHHLPYLVEGRNFQVVGVLLADSQVVKDGKYWKKRLKKSWKIGLFGMWNGVRMRRWYDEKVKLQLDIPGLDAWCDAHGVPFYRTPRLNGPETKAILAKLSPDLGISLGNGYISSQVFAIPKLGMLNIHHEVLPDYQNAQSIIWQLYNGSAETGYTIHQIDRQIDTGAILKQEKVPIHFCPKLSDTVATTYCHLLQASAAGLVSVLENLETALAQARPQGPGKSYTTPNLRQFIGIYTHFHRLQKQAVGEVSLRPSTADLLKISENNSENNSEDESGNE